MLRQKPFKNICRKVKKDFLALRLWVVYGIILCENGLIWFIAPPIKPCASCLSFCQTATSAPPSVPLGHASLSLPCILTKILRNLAQVLIGGVIFQPKAQKTKEDTQLKRLKKYAVAAFAIVATMALAACVNTASSQGQPAGQGYSTNGNIDAQEENYTNMPYVNGEFPSLFITSDYHPFEVDRDLWHDATLSLSGGSDEHNFEGVDVRLRGRGNSTWVMGPDKRPLRIRFEEPQHFLDSSHAHRDWILLANHLDMSLMRNYAAFYLGYLMDNLDSTPFTRFVNLYINGEYVGLYQLTDERDTGPGRIELAFDEDPALSEFYFELDGHVVGWLADQNYEWEDYFVANERAYDVRFPSSSARTQEHMLYMQNFMEAFDAAIYERDFEALSALIDIDTAIDFYIVQEITKDIDVSEFSIFMTIRGQGDYRRLHFGPLWDFDRSAGNTFYWNTPQFIFAGYRNHWFEGFLDMPEMRELIINRWNEVARDNALEMVEHLRHIAGHYEEAFIRNFERHNIMEELPPRWENTLPEQVISIDNWHDQAEFLFDWFDERIQWLDAYFNS